MKGPKRKKFEHKEPENNKDGTKKRKFKTNLGDKKRPKTLVKKPMKFKKKGQFIKKPNKR